MTTASSSAPAMGPIPRPGIVVAAVTADVQLPSAAVLAGVVHSVFGRVVNVAPAAGTLWCLAARDVPPGPRTVVVDVDGFDVHAVHAGQPVAVDDAGLLRVGDRLRVGLHTAAAWECPRVAGRVRADRLRRLERLVCARGVAGGARAGRDAFSRAVADRIATGLAGIRAAVAAADTAALTRSAAGLVGLGTGLTPAGDDVLTGLAFTAAQLGGPLASIPAAVAAAATAGSTHDISLVALREACRGRAATPLAAVLTAVCDEADADLPTLSAALLAIGHTSGTDQACGLLAAARLSRP